MTAANLAALRADADWLLDKNPIAAARIHQAAVLLETAEALKTKADALLETTASARTDQPGDRADRVVPLEHAVERASLDSPVPRRSRTRRASRRPSSTSFSSKGDFFANRASCPRRRVAGLAETSSGSSTFHRECHSRTWKESPW